MPCTKSTSELQGHIVLACWTMWAARRGVLGTLVWVLGPFLKARIQQHITLPPEPPCVPKALSWHSWAPYCTNEAWQVWINPLRQTAPWFSLLALQVLPAIQPGKADICLVNSQLIWAQQDAKAAVSCASPMGLRLWCFNGNRQDPNVPQVVLCLAGSAPPSLCRDITSLLCQNPFQKWFLTHCLNCQQWKTKGFCKIK